MNKSGFTLIEMIFCISTNIKKYR
ncbi:prepilin-type N-terminal cleavage/methylation domain-containing protein [Longibaculum muris]